MNKPESNYSAVIVGASIAGCSTALRLANQGVRVAIVEKQSNARYYKKMCSHIVHPSGLTQLIKLGLWDGLQASGAQPTYMDVENQGDRLFYPLFKKAEAANIERRYLDPALKKLVTNHPNITTFFGYRVTELLRNNKRVVGLIAAGLTAESSNQKVTFTCPLVIAADGRMSRTARLDKCRNHIVENHRVALFSYFTTRDLMVSSKIWVKAKGESYIACFPNSNKVLLSCYISASKFKEIHDVQSFYDGYVRHFVESQGIQVGEQVDDLLIAKDTSTLYRAPNSKGLVFVGDAFIAADPLTGIGCSWAMSSAALLSRCVGKSLAGHSAKGAQTLKGWRLLRLNVAVESYHLIHRVKYRLPAYAMAWLSLKGKAVYDKRWFGFLAGILGERRSRAEN